MFNEKMGSSRKPSKIYENKGKNRIIWQMSQFAFQFSRPRLPAPSHRRRQSRPAGVPGRPESKAAAQQHPGIVSDQAHSAHPQVSFAPAADAQPNRHPGR